MFVISFSYCNIINTSNYNRNIRFIHLNDAHFEKQSSVIRKGLVGASNTYTILELILYYTVIAIVVV